MKKNNLFKRILSIMFIVLILLFMPLISYSTCFNSFVYAVNENILAESYKYIIPSAALLNESMKKSVESVTQQDLANGISKMRNIYANVYNTLPVDYKMYIAKTFTDYTLEELNAALGTSYSQSTIDNWGVEQLKQKILNNDSLSSFEMQKLGIHNLAAYQFKEELANNFIKANQGSLFEKNGQLVKITQISDYSKWVKVYKYEENLFNYFPVKVQGGNILTYDSLMKTFNVSSSYVFETDSFYRIRISGSTSRLNTTDSTVPLEEATLFFPTYLNPMKVYLDKLDGGTWTTLWSNTNAAATTNTIFINAIMTYTGLDLTMAPMYSKSFQNTFDLTWQGNGVFFGQINDNFISYSPPAGELLNTSVNSDELAASLLAAIGALGEQVGELEYTINSYVNSETGQDEIIMIGDGVAVDTGIPMEEPIPDTSGDITEGALNIPILGSILSILKGILSAVNNWHDEWKTPDPNNSEDDGTDWGDFKGLFDIFYIFYYLILIVIIILIKLLNVVLNISNIQPSFGVLSDYPTILTGIDYIKNLKVANLNFTIQQVFEYAFTVFFFIFIVKTIQKLYRSIVSDYDFKITDTIVAHNIPSGENNIHVPLYPNNQLGYNEQSKINYEPKSIDYNPYENIKITDYTKR